MLDRAWKFANRPLIATVVGTVLATWLLAWRWADVKPHVAPAWDSLVGWLSEPTHITRRGLFLRLGLVAAVAVLVGSGAIRWLRARAREAPVPADFNPTGLQLAAMGVLKTRYDCATPLGMLHQDVKVLAATAGGMPFLARQMEDLERDHIVRIEETGRTDRQYYLTTQGRDWLLDQIKHAHHAGEPAKFDPGSFKLTPARCRALLALSHRVEVLTTLAQLYELATNDVHHYDPSTSKAQVQHDMDNAKRAGLVSIEPTGTGIGHYYALTVPDGRDWVLANEGNLKAAGRVGMKKKDLD